MPGAEKQSGHKVNTGNVFLRLFYVYTSVLPECVSVHCMCEVKVEGIRSSGSVTGSWELKLGPLQEHPVVSATESAPKLLNLKGDSVARLDKAPWRKIRGQIVWEQFCWGHVPCSEDNGSS